MVEKGAYLEDAVILPDVQIHANCRLKRVVVDKGCNIPAGTIIGENLEADRERFHVTEKGIVLVTSEMLGQELHYAN